MNLSETEDPEEIFYEYFTNRPTWFLIFKIFTFLMSFFGTFGNATIIMVKLKKFREVMGIDLMIINLAAAQILFSFTSVFYLVDEVYHDLTEHSMCKIKFFLHSLTIASTGYSCAILLVTSCFSLKLKQKLALASIIFVWTCSLIIAFPYHNSFLWSVPMSNGKSRYMCIMFVESLDSIQKYRFSLAITGYLIPFILIFGTSIVAFIKRREELKNREMVLYPIIFGFYFFITSFYMELFDLALFFFNLKVNLEANFILRFLYTGCAIINAIACFFVDSKFFERYKQFLKLSSPNAVVSYKKFNRDSDCTFIEI